MKKIKVGVIPAAGKGNRIKELPLTKILPKPMLPVLNKPILEYVVEKMRDVGIETIYIIVGPKKEVIQEYFEDGSDFGVDIKYIEQEEPLGIAHAIGLTSNFIDKPFMVILGDDLTITDSLQDTVGTFFSKSAVAVEGIIEEKNEDILKQTNCVVLGEGNKILQMVEKPSVPVSNIRGCGIYVFSPIVFKYIKQTPTTPPRNQKEITVTINTMAEMEPVYGVYVKGLNINVNTLSNLLTATDIFLREKQKGKL